MKFQVRWEVTEVHEAVIDVEDEDAIDDGILAAHEDGESYASTPDRTLLEYEEVNDE